jgi:DNA-binding HxlR family transcriptional regulator
MTGPARTPSLAAGPASPQDSLAGTDAGGGAFTAAGQVPDCDDEATSPGLCPYFHEAVELVGKRWTGAMVAALVPGPRRFCEIAQAVPEISDRLLSRRLRELEQVGIVERQVLAGSPVRVSYALTSKGMALEPALSELRRWAQRWLRAA